MVVRSKLSIRRWALAVACACVGPQGWAGTLGHANAPGPVPAHVTTIPQTVSGAKVLYFVDKTIGTDTFLAAMTDLGIVPTSTNDPTAFVSLLDQGGWDLVIALQQDYCQASAFGPDLIRYVSGGGKAIYADFCANTDPSVVTAFGGVPTGNINAAQLNGQLYTMSRGRSGKAATITNPGWTIYSVGYTPLTGAVTRASFDYKTSLAVDSGIISANSGRTLLNGLQQDAYTTFAQGQAIAEDEIQALLK